MQPPRVADKESTFSAERGRSHWHEQLSAVRNSQSSGRDKDRQERRTVSYRCRCIFTGPCMDRTDEAGLSKKVFAPDAAPSARDLRLVFVL